MTIFCCLLCAVSGLLGGYGMGNFIARMFDIHHSFPRRALGITGAFQGVGLFLSFIHTGEAGMATNIMAVIVSLLMVPTQVTLGWLISWTIFQVGKQLVRPLFAKVKRGSDALADTCKKWQDM